MSLKINKTFSWTSGDTVASGVRILS